MFFFLVQNVVKNGNSYWNELSVLVLNDLGIKVHHVILDLIV